MNILFLHGDSFCYDSAAYFIKCISREFDKAGWQTEHLFCPKESRLAALSSCYDKQFDVIFDINSILPCLQDSDGSFCLNRIHGQVWHYILDHPFYHHDVLKCPIDNFHVICLDENHAEFVRTHYPHIKQVVCIPLAAEQAAQLIPYQERRHEVLFTGTYTDSDLILYRVMKQPEAQRKLFEQTVQLLLDEPCLTQEKAVAKVTKCDKTDNIPLLLRENYLIDMYLRACLREELLVQLIQKKIPVTLYGHNWEQFLEKCKSSIPWAEKYLHLMGEAAYEELPLIYADTKIALNQLPWFKAGMHDRIPLALMNGCVCVTDESLYLEKRFVDGEELYFYSLENMEEAADMVWELLEQPHTAVKTAARGYSHALRQLSWKCWAEQLIAFIV